MAANAKPLTKSQFQAAIAEKTELSKKDVAAVLDAMTEVIQVNLGSKGPGVVNVNGLLKIEKKHKPAVPARKGVNPFTGEEQMFKAKPARDVVKIKPLKAVKDMV